MLDLKGKVILVSGAGRGIGRSTALAFAREGALVAGLARTAFELDAVAVEAPQGAMLPVIADVSNAEDVARAVTLAEAELGPVDMLINNAAIFLQKTVLETTAEEWMRTMAVNTLGPLLLTRAVLPGMIKRGFGRIVNLCSTSSHRAYPGQGAYCASKHALLGLTKVLAEETHGTGVRVHAVSPGGVDTTFVSERQNVDFARYMAPDEVAEIVLFVARMDRIAVIDDVIVRREEATPFR